MAANAPTGDRKAKLAAVRAIALVGVEIEPRAAQPADGEIFQLVPDGEDAQQLAGEVLPLILGRVCELKLQGAFAGVAKPRAAEVITGRPCRILGRQGRINGSR